jgi:hypothetical protein
VEQTDLLRYAIDALERLGIPYAIVGSFASGVWGESRFTQDIDILIDIAHSQLPALCAAFPSDKFYVSDSAAREAVNLGGQFNVIHPASGNKIDFMIAGDNQLAAAQLQRAQRVADPISTCAISQAFSRSAMIFLIETTWRSSPRNLD